MSGTQWEATLQSVEELATATELAQVLEAALTSGFLDHCQSRISIATLAERTDLEPDLVSAICATLRVLRVIDVTSDDQVVVGPAYESIFVGGFGQRVIDRLRGAAARGRVMEKIFDRTSTYWNLDGSTRLALAACVTGDARTDWGRDRIVDGVRAIPRYHDALLRGGRMLSLGSGVSGLLCALLRVYPGITAVGVELAEDLVRVAQQRATEAGVAERVRFEVGDAAAYRDPDTFDIVWWSQTYFVREEWQNALAAAYANLRPGGLLVLPDPPVPDPNLGSSAATTIEALMRAAWGIPTVAGDELCEQLAIAGFTDVAPGRREPPILPIVTARRPSE